MTPVGLGLVLLGLTVWWLAPTMAAPLIGLAVAVLGVVLASAGSVRAARRRRSD